MVIRKRSEPVLLYQMKASLIDIEPSIWRRFKVTSDHTLHRLHLILQSIMGWDNYHLYDFRIDGIPYGEQFEDYEPGMRQSHGCKLSSVIHSQGQKLIYSYDFGDDWQHEIVVENISPADSDGLYPVCIAGERASPVEDCGGVSGYYELLEILSDPDHHEYEAMKEWACRDGEDYAPEECNLKSVNRELRFYWPKGRRWSYPLAMNSVDRRVAIIRPKGPFLKWLKNMPNWDLDLTLKDLKAECLSILIPGFEDSEKTDSFMKAIYERIFEAELSGWYKDETVWPQKRSYALFRRWFDVEIHSIVVDTLDEEIEKEDF